MTAMGIIGIILAGFVGASMFIGTVHVFVEEREKQKLKNMYKLIDYACQETEEMATSIIDKSIQMMPNMIQSMYKTLENDGEP